MLAVLENILAWPAHKNVRMAGALAIGGGVFWLLVELIVQFGYYTPKFAFLSVWLLGSATLVACIAIYQACRDRDDVGVVHGILLSLGCLAIGVAMTIRAFDFYAMTKVIG